MATTYNKKEKAQNKIDTIEGLQLANIKWRERNNGSMFSIREQGKPPIDLYPTTLKWKKSGGVAIEGDIKDFVKWYELQSIDETPKNKRKIIVKRESVQSDKEHKGLVKDDLNEEQLQSFNDILDFINTSPDQEYVLNGAAGCGKTSTLKVILDYIGDTLEVYCTAPTNQAVKVIASATGRNYTKTIFGLLGLRLVQHDDTGPHLSPEGESKLGDYNLLVIDECSMISRELYTLISNEVRKHSHVKILFVGDNAQLPPVEDEGIESPTFSVTNSSLLTTVMRTAEGNPILENVTLVRSNVVAMQDIVNPFVNQFDEFKVTPQLNYQLKSVEKPLDKTTRLSDDGKVGIVYHNRNEFNDMMDNCLDEFASEDYEDDKNHVRMLAYTNKTVNYLNKLVRSRIFCEHDEISEYMKGEEIILSSPVTETDKGGNEQIVYTNGERLVVEQANERVYLDRASGYSFSYWDLLVDNYEAIPSLREKRYIKVVAKDSPTPNELISHEIHNPQYKIANYERFSATMFSIMCSDLARKAKVKATRGGYYKKLAWQEFFDFKKQYVNVSYAYATTIHRSQGSTFTNTYVIGDDLDKLHWDQLQLNKLRYVGMSRSSKKLHVLSS
jgi:hypothetical protein